MRVVYTGEPWGTALARCRSLQALEDEVHYFDSTEDFQRHPWLGAIEKRTFFGPVFERTNRRFLAFCEQKRPQVVWIDKGLWVWPSTLRRLREQGAFLVQHNTDRLEPAHWRARWLYRVLRQTVPLYDIYFTTNLIDHAELSRQGHPRTELTYLGYDDQRFNDTRPPADVAARYARRLLFIGHHEPRTERGIQALVDAGLPVTVMGYGWNRAQGLKGLGNNLQGQVLSDADYVNYLKSTEIALCFVSEWNGNETASRSFEIPACGTFLLAMRTRQHSECYEEGREAEFFGDHAELVRKARHYLEQGDLRREIARRGQQRCVGSDYSWDRYMRDDWAKVRQALNGHG